MFWGGLRWSRTSDLHIIWNGAPPGTPRAPETPCFWGCVFDDHATYKAVKSRAPRDTYRKRTMQNEMKQQCQKQVYKNGTFIATERSCTWQHRITTDGKQVMAYSKLCFLFEGTPAHNLFGHFYKSGIHQKTWKKLRHSATHWKQSVTVSFKKICFSSFLSLLYFFSFFLVFLFFL